MKIQIVSDIHLEFDTIDIPVNQADVLIAAGDIGLGMQGLAWLQSLNCPVIYVAGNHEYWNHDIDTLIASLKVETVNTNVSYLENTSVSIGDVRFLGCTLWTDLNGTDFQVASEIVRTLNDYRYILKSDRYVLPEDIIERHMDSRAWLEAMLSQPFDGTTIIVTHHAPIHRSWYHDNVSNLKYAYCNDLSDLMRKYTIDLWVHGHVHQSCDYIADDVRVVCNPRGYAHTNEVKTFSPVKMVSV